jgi:hypothetical protein
MIIFIYLNDLAPRRVSSFLFPVSSQTATSNKQQAPSDRPETWSVVSGQWPESSPTLSALAHRDHQIFVIDDHLQIG